MAAAKKSKKKNNKKGANSKKMSPKRKTTRKTNSSNRNPAYILFIMLLVAVILVMFNKLYLNKDGNKFARSNNRTKINKQSRKSKTKKTNIITSIKKELLPEPKKEKKNNNDKIVKEDKIKKVPVKLYFIKFNEKTEQISYIPVYRKINSDTKLENSLKLLMSGLNRKEQAKGYITAITQDIRIKRIKVKNKIAVIDLNKNLSENFVVNKINQIFYTATQFPEIDAITLKVNGKVMRKAVGHGHGRFFQWPMRGRL